MPSAYLVEILLRLIDATAITLFLTLAAATLGLSVATPMALARLSRNAVLYWFSSSFVFVFRGTPALVQLFFLYFGLARLDFVRESFLWVILKSPWWCGLIALSLNTAAYTTEIIRGALMAVPRGQVEAAHALGLSPLQTFLLVRVPTAIRIALPAYGNELILLLKATTIVSTITILDLMGEAKLIYTETFDPFVPLFTAAGIYIVLVYGIGRAIGLAERLMFPDRKYEAAETKRATATPGETGH